MRDNLKPCPFCGARLTVTLDRPDAAEHPYGDGDCILAGSGITDDQFSAWNTRAEVEAAVKRALDAAAKAVEWRYNDIGISGKLQWAHQDIRALDPARFV